jgi:hypothetical protein
MCLCSRSIYLSIICLYFCLSISVYLSVCLSVYLFIYLSRLANTDYKLAKNQNFKSQVRAKCVYVHDLSIYLSICLSIYLSVCLSIYISNYLSIDLSVAPLGAQGVRETLRFTSVS